MAQKQEGLLFSPDKIEWLLSGGLETLAPGERELLLVLAETRLQEGYRPTSDEKRVIEQLQAMAGEDYDARDIKRKVRTMVKARSKPDATPLGLPPVFDRLLNRFRRSRSEEG